MRSKHPTRVVALASLLAACTTGQMDSRDDANPSDDGLVVAPGAEAPQPAELAAVGALVLDGRTFCTGTLIADRVVLTAGHCLVGLSQPEALRFVTGLDARAPDTSTTATRLILHPRATSITNDIGLVFLAESIPGVAPLAPVDRLDDTLVGRELLYVGYGRNGPKAPDSVGIRRAAFMKVDKLKADRFEKRGPGSNACSGDSGGPALLRGDDDMLRVAGVSFTADPQCSELTVSMRVDVYRDFIDARGEGAFPCGPAQFECASGVCLPDVRRCNGFVECRDRDDESVAVCGELGSDGPCGRLESPCDGTCVPACDGFAQCLDGSDESRARCGDEGSDGPCGRLEYSCDEFFCMPCSDPTLCEQTDGVTSGLEQCPAE